MRSRTSRISSFDLFVRMARLSYVEGRSGECHRGNRGFSCPCRSIWASQCRETDMYLPPRRGKYDRIFGKRLANAKHPSIVPTFPPNSSLIARSNRRAKPDTEAVYREYRDGRVVLTVRL